ncbi:MAG: hypothetical protein SAL07_17365 [Oscillatoria sp. PMC 1051.18]|nr:hypothetical protein [Oscillatoria sp. PMC 1050.18]MEC5031672.1 hypothetical protein [Oscillatoria sp. PMC 1051.18]
MKLARYAILLAVSLSLNSCANIGEKTLSKELINNLEWTTGGCNDVYIYGKNFEDTIAWFFESPGLVAAAVEAGDTETFELDLSEENSRLRLETGERLTTEICNDVVIDDSRPLVKGTYRAISGQATVEIIPDDGDGQKGANSTAIFTFSDVVFETESGKVLTFEKLSPVTVKVGWLPG